MLDDLVVSRAETAGCAEGPGEGADDHVDLLGVDVLRLGDAAAGPAEHAKGPRLVEDDAELVLFLELDLGFFFLSADGALGKDDDNNDKER